MKFITLAAIAALCASPAAIGQDKLAATAGHTFAEMKNLVPGSCEPPEYPIRARDNGQTGMVEAGFLVGPDGVVVESFIALSSGVRELDRATIASLSKCRFTPPTAGGKPATRWSNVLYVWQLTPPGKAGPEVIDRAERGSAAVHYLVSLMYSAGYMVDQDEQAALRWLRKAAERGHAAAQYSLGAKYESGSCGLGRDDEQAAFWYRKAAAQKNTFARDKLHFGFGSIPPAPEREG